jgi:hypothetical protein
VSNNSVLDHSQFVKSGPAIQSDLLAFGYLLVACGSVASFACEMKILKGLFEELVSGSPLTWVELVATSSIHEASGAESRCRITRSWTIHSL